MNEEFIEQAQIENEENYEECKYCEEFKKNCECEDKKEFKLNKKALDKVLDEIGKIYGVKK